MNYISHVSVSTDSTSCLDQNVPSGKPWSSPTVCQCLKMKKPQRNRKPQEEGPPGSTNPSRRHPGVCSSWRNGNLKLLQSSTVLQRLGPTLKLLITQNKNILSTVDVPRSCKIMAYAHNFTLLIHCQKTCDSQWQIKNMLLEANLGHTMSFCHNNPTVDSKTIKFAATRSCGSYTVDLITVAKPKTFSWAAVNLQSSTKTVLHNRPSWSE